MWRQVPRRCALVRFVHRRCGLNSPAPMEEIFPDSDAAPQVPRLDFGDIEGLAAAIRANKPVILRGAQLPPGCFGTSEDPDALLLRIRKLCGHREVPVRVAASEAHEEQKRRLLYRFVDGPVPHSQWRLYRVLDEVITTAAACRNGYPKQLGCYAASLSIEARVPELAPHLLPVMELMEGLSQKLPLGPVVPMTPVIYFGAGSQRTPLHFDPTENLTLMLQGRKRFRLFPPSASSNLQPRGGSMAALACWHSGIIPAVYSNIDPWAIDATDGPKPLDVELDTKEILYLPTAWWHAVVGSPEANLSIVFVHEPLC